MMGIVLPETCWACNKICNKYHLLHLVGVLFPHINDDARSKSLQIYQSHCYSQIHNILELVQRNQCCLSLQMWLFLLNFSSCYFKNSVIRTFLFVFSYTDTPILRLCSYVPEGQAKIGIECVCLCVCIYIWSLACTQGRWSKIQTRAHWNLNGRSITAPRPVLSPSSILTQPSSHFAVIPARSKLVPVSKMLFHFFLLSLNCVSPVSRTLKLLGEFQFRFCYTLPIIIVSFEC